jgi:tRNA G26 N,N-dimethylase Trm1
MIQNYLGLGKYLNKEEVMSAFESLNKKISKSSIEPHYYKTDASPKEVINIIKQAKIYKKLNIF